MASKPMPRFVVFARKLTLVSGLAVPLAGCADKAASQDGAAVVDSSDSDISPPGVKPFPPDAADDSDVQPPSEVAAETPTEVATEVAEEVARCMPFLGVATLPDAGGDVSIAPRGVKPMPEDAGNRTCDGGLIPVGGPLAPPEFLA